MPAALTPPWKVHTPIREPPVMRENASATATAYRSSRIISIGTPSRPSAAYGPALDGAIDAVLPGIDLERQQCFARLDHDPRPLVHFFRPGLHTRVVVLLHEPQHARLEFDAV